jgi:hypothetical protein
MRAHLICVGGPKLVGDPIALRLSAVVEQTFFATRRIAALSLFVAATTSDTFCEMQRQGKPGIE